MVYPLNKPNKSLLYNVMVPVGLAVILGPGMGQLFNKQFKKGCVLIAVSIALLFAFSIWLSRAAMAYLPADINTVDRAFLRTIIQTHIVADQPGTFYTYEILLGLLWVYGIIDAYLGGMFWHTAKPAEPLNTGRVSL